MFSLSQFVIHSIYLQQTGTYVGSSYMYATVRDWARFGLLLLRDGVWDGSRILPQGWVDYVRTPSKTSNGMYGAHFWLNGGEGAERVFIH